MDRHFRFSGGTQGAWRVDAMRTLVGPPLARVAGLDVLVGASGAAPIDSEWVLQGFTSNIRYAEKDELHALRARQTTLGQPGNALRGIDPDPENPAWWSLAQDERRTIFETRSRHIAIGMDYLPHIARQLHHCRDIDARFDFLTWFEFAPEHAELFDRMLVRLRTTPEWEYVDREIDIRMTRPG